jgi:Alpha galactosidase A
VPPIHKVADNGLSKTPPMGWNSWNKFSVRVDDAAVRGMAEAMASNGMKEAGYQYISIDHTWEGGRDAQGNITTNKKFSDMKALADYVHGRGLKIGIYSSPGPNTCAGYEGNYGHEDQDARTYAAWGIDYLKYDWCGARDLYTDQETRALYQVMDDALLKAGRRCGWQRLAHNGRHSRYLGLDDHHWFFARRTASLSDAGTLERSGHARDRQRRHERRRIQNAYELVVDSCSPAARRK